MSLTIKVHPQTTAFRSAEDMTMKIDIQFFHLPEMPI